MAKKKNRKDPKASGGIRKQNTRKRKPHPIAAKIQKQGKSAAKTHKPRDATIPFHPKDTILLIGEGDFSFTQSLLHYHASQFKKVVATTLETPETLQEKHLDIVSRLDEIRGHPKCGGVFHQIDATLLHEYKFIKKTSGKGGYDRIVFNFPHVGGKSTDVNRQVRYNQEMLVKFFKAAMELLVRKKPEGKQTPNENTSERSFDTEQYNWSDMEDEDGKEIEITPQPPSCILVTLFEGEPYTLWCIQNLARHVGLAVKQSFAFSASAYPGYSHARTLGDIRGKGGWKGEQRPARTYEFVLKEEKEKPGSSKKKKASDSTSDEDD